MTTIQSFRVQLARRFGTRLHYGESAIDESVEWLTQTVFGQRRHTEVKVQSCLTRPLEPTGNARVDKMLGADFKAGFESGNVSSNLQTSQMLPARGELEVNGFTVLDGRPIVVGQLQEKAFSYMEKSSWNDARDRQALGKIKALIQALPLDTGCTVSRIMHMRAKDTRYDQPSPVHTHGWLVVDDLNKLIYRTDFANSGVGLKLMDRAQQVLTCEHTDPVTLLEITGGRITFVDEAVFAKLAEVDGRLTRQTIADFVVDPRQPWDLDQSNDSAAEAEDNEQAPNEQAPAG